MRLSAEHLQAQGFTHYRTSQVAGAGRTFDAVAKPGQEYEVSVSSSQTSKPSYSPVEPRALWCWVVSSGC